MAPNFFYFVLLVLMLDGGIVMTNAEPTWTSLRVTWGLNVFSSQVFAKMPRTEAAAKKDGFAKLAGDCSGKFLGKRYIKGIDTSVVVLFDKNGFIAGIQSGVPKSQVQLNASFSYTNSPAFQVDRIGEEEIYFVTAYFVDPSIICDRGRSKAEYDEQGTGTGLFLQNGSNPIQDSAAVPLYERDIESTQWTMGRCFPSMGVHYWYNMNENFDCAKMYPATVIYNRGKLTSFAFVFSGYFEFSKRFEHPPKSAFERFLPTPVPKCLYEEYDRAGGFSTLHVYFSIRPWNIFC